MAFIKKNATLLTSLFVFAVYLFTLAPSIVEIDSGELATVQIILGIAHPTGYPLFTLIGHLLLNLSLPFTKIYQANLLAAIWCAAGIFFFIKSAQIILQNSNQVKTSSGKTKSKKKPTNDLIVSESEKNFTIALSSILSGIVLAFSKTYWMQSTSVEVYSLQVFLLNLIVFAVLKAYFSDLASIKKWILVAIFLALGFSNHMTTLLIFPFIAILFFMKEKFNVGSIKIILKMLVVFIPILIALYAYLPLRAAANPLLNWGNPINFENLFRHVSGKQYQVWLFASFEAAEKQLAYFLNNFPGEFGYIGLIIGLVGLVYSFKVYRKIFFTLIVTFLFAVLYSINYEIVDIDSYFLTAYVMFSFFIAFGFYRIFFLLKQKLVKNYFAVSIVVILSLIPLVLNFEETNQRDVYTFEDYTKAILQSTESNSIIFSYQWDYFISASYYFQFVEHFRPDVTVIDKELMRRSWYYNQLKHNHPDVIKNLRGEISSFLTALQPFEQGRNFNPETIEKYYRTLMTKLVSENIEKRNYYIGLELFQNEMQRGEFSLPEGYQLVPHLILFKVAKGTEYVPAPDPNFTIRFPEHRNKYIDFIENAVGGMLTYRAAYELQFNKPERAKIYIDKVKRDFPNYQIPYNIESRIK